MKYRIITIHFVSLCLLPLLSDAASRELALKPHLDLLWSRWKELPTEYQRQKRGTLEGYLALLTTTNGAAWNDTWGDFSAKMGSEFAPLSAALIEAQKVAEAYEAGFPNPEGKLPRIADTILERVPTNALLFIQSDIFETVLRLRQEDGKRLDVLVLNSSRLMDQAYLYIALAGQRLPLKTGPAGLTKRVIEDALQKKRNGDAEFRALDIVDGRVHANGLQLMTSLNRLMMREISDAAPGRICLVLPLFQENDPAARWAASANVGMLFRLAPDGSSDGNSLLLGWQALLDEAAPLGSPLHAEMATTINQSIRVAAAILTAQGQNESSGKLRKLWTERLKALKVVDSRDIQISEQGKMVQQSHPADAAPTHR